MQVRLPLHVRSDSSIATLHDLLQIAFDWSDFHLHRFVIRGQEYGVSRMGCIGAVEASSVPGFLILQPWIWPRILH
jgi:Plasmid pRiA4b ORF-3-like protein